MFIGACECGTRVYSTCKGPGHGRVFSVRCCAAAYCLPGRDVQSEFILELVRYILRGCECDTACVCAVRPKQGVLYVYACMYGGRYVQPERCNTRRESMYSCLYGVRHGQFERALIYGSPHAWVYTLHMYVCVQCLAWAAWAMHGLCVGPRAWVRTLYVYMYSVWHGQPGRRTECT